MRNEIMRSCSLRLSVFWQLRKRRRSSIVVIPFTQFKTFFDFLVVGSDYFLNFNPDALSFEYHSGMQGNGVTATVLPRDYYSNQEAVLQNKSAKL